MLEKLGRHPNARRLVSDDRWPNSDHAPLHRAGTGAGHPPPSTQPRTASTTAAAPPRTSSLPPSPHSKCSADLSHAFVENKWLSMSNACNCESAVSESPRERANQNAAKSAVSFPCTQPPRVRGHRARKPRSGRNDRSARGFADVTTAPVPTICMAMLPSAVASTGPQSPGIPKHPP